ncbi:aspartate aminotransferase, cytoplasmic [Aspergillus udagawae]|uniref:Aspartate aminotransferase, cytoplasmic n=1 Tax=Aspergillus udagawae TaxID=91492 RepID=A0ABQ1BCZ2_9EURO|nr:aspartate aminotransferase, cytoplasmic [Aspergillus udagawae]
MRYYDQETKTIDMASYLSTLQAADPGSVIVLHNCAHNPTGLDPTPRQWKEIGAIMKRRSLFPLFDAAYLGFNSGDFDKDEFAIRYFIHELGMESAVCLSFAENMGLYGERVGCLILAAATEEIAVNSQSVLESLQRSEISNPPAYGARVAERVLADEGLRWSWFEDIRTMSRRMQSMRKSLYKNLVANLEKLKTEYHIYMAENSRISIAGLNPANVEYVAQSIAAVLNQEE